MKKNWTVFIAAILLLFVGLGFVFYPIISKLFNECIDDQVVDDFKNSSDFSNIDLDRLYKDIKAYNDNLFINGKKDHVDMYVYAESAIDLMVYGAPDDMFGYVEAPDISLRLLVYLGASMKNMKKGAGNLNQTTIPIGGVNTNSVLAAHSGMITHTMFDNIPKLKVGNDVYLSNFWGVLHYRVAETHIVLPSASYVTDIQSGRDLLTLLTCYPYGKNTQRFVVVCERVLD